MGLDSENIDITVVTKKPQDARELKVHTAFVLKAPYSSSEHVMLTMQ